MTQHTPLLADFADVTETAAELGVSVRTVHRYIDQPDGLPHLYLGGKLRFHRPTVKEWLMSRMRRPNPTRDAGRRAA